MCATTAPVSGRETTVHRLGMAWVALCAVLALHVLDEASTHFLSIYNPTLLAMRSKLGFWPMPTFEFREWLIGLLTAIVILFALSPLAFRNVRWVRPVFYFVAIVAGVLNALGHATATILGHTVSSVHFRRPAPGFYSSLILFAAAIYLLEQLRRTRHA